MKFLNRRNKIRYVKEPPIILSDAYYSTDEIMVGRWIDGKPLYRKVIEFPNEGFVTGGNIYSHGINDIDKVVDFDLGMYSLTSGEYCKNRMSLSNYDNNNSYVAGKFWMNATACSRTRVSFDLGADWTPGGVYAYPMFRLTVLYTKI